MFEVFNDRIFELRETLRRKEKVEFMLNQSKEELKIQKNKKNNLNRILQKEEKDVRQLESLSITGLFYSILGSKEEQLDKERQEYLAAKLKYDECCNSIKDIEEEIRIYKDESNKYTGIEEEYRSLLNKKRDFILSRNDVNSQRLKTNVDKAIELELDIKEIKEAINAGDNVKSALGEVIKSLRSAENWGMWDILGGGFIATAAKHSKIDDAKEQVYNVQRLLRIFKKELSDVDTSTDIDINIGSFETFADYFFDGLITDWIVQNKINDSLDRARSMDRDISRVLNTLTRNLDHLEMELEKTQVEIKRLIEEC
ncbi:hypothetical protein [Clostridium sp. Cult2]|uniref:hypothetical protein n=1 Tax=Clostridium sp. Cult2 TaxID=2079003 RepID=UPI001F3AF4DC|nr:hypothetical protein [Clostridium sp. Cult2]MCF6466034.1 hypothetical protein [Clostridium sp. Cult2]